MTVPLLFMEDKDEKTLSPLEARVAFAGMLDNAEKWAREVWRKNPQLPGDRRDHVLALFRREPAYRQQVPVRRVKIRFAGEKRDRDKKEDDRIIYGADPIPKQDQIDIFDLKNKDKWTETNVLSNPFAKLLGDNE